MQYFSAESGEDDIESMVRRMRKAKKLDPFPAPDDDPLAFNFNAVPLGDEDVAGMLQEAIR